MIKKGLALPLNSIPYQNMISLNKLRQPLRCLS